MSQSQEDFEYPTAAMKRNAGFVPFSERKAIRFIGENTEKRKMAAKRRNTSIRSKVPMVAPNFMKFHLAAVPNRQRHNLRWAYHGSISAAANSYTELAVVVLNGAYQPCAALSATSPSGFAKLMSDFYTKAVVMNAGLVVTVCNDIIPQAATVVQPSILFGSSVTTNSTTLSTAQQAIQNGHSCYKSCPQGVVSTLSHPIDIGKFLGVKDLISGTDYNCTSAANPSQVVDSHVWADNRSSTLACVLDVTIVLTLDVIFYDPNQI